MIAYEMQLRYVILDRIQSETNSVQDKIQSEKKSENFFLANKFFFKENFLWKSERPQSPFGLIALTGVER